MKDLGHKWSRADPCLYYSWNEKNELAICASWIDDNLCTGNDDIIANETKKLAEQFDVDDVKELEEYVGCKIKLDHEKQCLKLTQLVFLQSFKDEFQMSQKKPTMPHPSGTVLTRMDLGAGKLLLMKQWLHPDI